MNFTLRQFLRSRPLRALGVLAWLMLVVNSLAVAPLSMAAGHVFHPATPAVHAAPASTSAMLAVRASGDDGSCCSTHPACCSGLAGHGCSCAAACSASLPPGALMALASAGIGSTYALLPSLSAPSRQAAPPLRPPAV